MQKCWSSAGRKSDGGGSSNRHRERYRAGSGRGAGSTDAERRLREERRLGKAEPEGVGARLTS